MKFQLLSLLYLVPGILADPALQVLANTKELSTLNSYVRASTNLTKLLSSASTFTFLAPSNAALDVWLNSGNSFTPDLIEATIRYHLIHGLFPTPSFTNRSQFPHSFLENSSYANVTGGQVVELIGQDGQANIISGNKNSSTITSPPGLICAGCFIQIINKVLDIPVDIIKSLSKFDLQNFVAMLSAGNFVTAADSPLIQTVLGAPNITYFAPNTPEALASFSNSVKGMTPQQISAFFGYHVVAGISGYSSNLQDGMELKTLQGSDLKISVRDGQIYVNAAKIITSDYLIANGVLHTIDSNLDRFNVTTPPLSQPSNDTSKSAKNNGLGAGAKAGIAIAVIFGVAIIAAIAFFFIRRGRRVADGTPRGLEGADKYGPEGGQSLVHKRSENTLELDAGDSFNSLPPPPKSWEISPYEVNVVELAADPPSRR